jgi:isochorismate hydrolase
MRISTPEVKKALDNLNATGPLSCIIVGIESHICVTQTTIDLLRAGHKVYVIADGVSSCNKEEVPIALARLRHEGAVITTSESFIYEFMGDAGTDEYVRDFPRRALSLHCAYDTHRSLVANVG